MNAHEAEKVLLFFTGMIAFLHCVAGANVPEYSIAGAVYWLSVAILLRRRM